MRSVHPGEARVIATIEPTAEALGYRIVRVRLMGNRRKTLQIMAERISDGHMGIDDCRRLSRAVSPVLEEVNPIQDDYVMEMSSPGIDRPLVRIEDFARFEGHDAKLETVAMIDGRKRFRGVLAGVAGDVIKLNTPEGEVSLPFSALAEARLVLTDRLIAEDLKRAKRAESEETEEEFLPPLAGEVGERSELEGDGAHAPSVSFADRPPARGGAKKTKRKDR